MASDVVVRSPCPVAVRLLACGQFAETDYVHIQAYAPRGSLLAAPLHVSTLGAPSSVFSFELCVGIVRIFQFREWRTQHNPKDRITARSCDMPFGMSVA